MNYDITISIAARRQKFGRNSVVSQEWALIVGNIGAEESPLLEATTKQWVRDDRINWEHLMCDVVIVECVDWVL
jgi:hypothetical protein